MPLIARKTFHGNGGPYLTVYTLVRWRRLSLCLHLFHRGDEDPDCHDHPFDFWSLILLGGYREHMHDGHRVTRGPLSVCYRAAAHRHRVELLGKTCWTLILKRDVGREWGFWRDGVFVPWRQYIADKGLVPIKL